MSSSVAVSDNTTHFQLKRFRSPQTVIARFVARRTLRSAVLWGYVFGAYVASKTVGYAKAYPTAEARAKIAHTFGNSNGLDALLGVPHHLETITGYAAWVSLGVVTIIGAIWAFLLATKYFRGEEDSGRSEILLAGQTTASRAAGNTLLGLSASFLVLYTVTAVVFVVIGQLHSIGFGVSSALFFALASVSGAALFLAIGAFTSQLMPTRSRASTLAAVLFGVFFLVRAMADVTTLHWLLDVTPLGWIERLQPLSGSQPIWLLPIFGTVTVLCLATIWLAGRRDLGEGIFADHDSARPRTALLNSPFMAAVRLTRSASIGWLTAAGLMAAFYGLLTSAAAQAFNQAGGAQRVVNRLEQVSHTTASKLYLGVVFLILMTVIMAYAASAVSKVREDEAEGYIDNFLVRPVSRLRWLWGRIFLVVMVGVAACLFGSLGTYVGQLNQHTGVSFTSLVLAGVNIVPAVLFTLGAGIFALGVWPRSTSIVAYGVIGWSFLISMLASGVRLSHWLLDTSVLYHIALAPSATPNWIANGIIAGLGLLLCCLGALAFRRRDLQTV